VFAARVRERVLHEAAARARCQGGQQGRHVLGLHHVRLRTAGFGVEVPVSCRGQQRLHVLVQAKASPEEQAQGEQQAFTAQDAEGQ
jgi:hypothetical protein